MLFQTTYIATSHLGNKSSGNQHSCAEHHKKMLKTKKYGLSCITITQNF